MRISELITRLQEIKEEHGDIETYYCGDEYHGDMDDDLFEEVFDYNEMGILIIR